jgi:hypothetical protein
MSDTTELWLLYVWNKNWHMQSGSVMECSYAEWLEIMGYK